MKISRLVWIVIPVALIIIPLVIAIEDAVFRVKSVRTTGEITNLNDSSFPGDTAQIRFQSGNGENIEFEEIIGFRRILRNNYTTGSKIDIRYEENNPKNSRTEGFPVIYIFTPISTIFGVFFLWFGLTSKPKE